MIKVKLFGVLHATIGLSYVELSTTSVQGVFDELSVIMEKNFIEDKKQMAENPPEEARNKALKPHKKLKFGDAVVYVNGERCLKKRMKLNDGDEIWLLSPAAGG